MSFASKLVSAAENLVTLPFRGAAVFFWFAFILLFLTQTQSPLWHGNLGDPDDYLYLVQALDGLKGQSWFDLVQHRMNPTDGTPVHFSHILSGFYSSIIYLFQFFYSDVRAAFLTSLLIPPVYLALFLFALDRISGILVHKSCGGLTAYVIAFSEVAWFAFMPGHIDHHGLELISSLCAFGCMAQMVRHPSEILWPIAAGLCLALSLAIALEVIVVLSLLTFSMGIWALAEGGAAGRSGSIFGLTLFATSSTFLFLTRSLDQAFIPSTQMYSIVYVLLMGFYALCLSGAWLVAKIPSRLTRFSTCALIACACGGFFLFYFPELKAGPYGGTNPAVARIILSNAREAWPLIRADFSLWKIALFIIPALGFWATLLMLWRKRLKPQRWIWLALAIILGVCSLLAAFYQARFYYYVQSFAAIPIAALVFLDWKSVSGRLFHKVRLAFVLLIIPLIPIIQSSIPQQGPIEKAEKTCDMHALAEVLNDTQRYGDHPRIIINTISEGPEILFRTPHKVLAAPFHTNDTGNLDAMRFLTTNDPNEAKAIARRRNAELVVVCAYEPSFQLYKDFGGNGIFAEQLIEGRVPAWLTPVDTRDFDGLQLFEIVPEPPGTL